MWYYSNRKYKPTNSKTKKSFTVSNKKYSIYSTRTILSFPNYSIPVYLIANFPRHHPYCILTTGTKNVWKGAILLKSCQIDIAMPWVRQGTRKVDSFSGNASRRRMPREPDSALRPACSRKVCAWENRANEVAPRQSAPTPTIGTAFNLYSPVNARGARRSAAVNERGNLGENRS